VKANKGMELQTVSDKNLSDLERLSRELLVVLRKSKMLDTPLAEMLYSLENEAGNVRRARFDANDSEYHGY
jgi:hypothetical protein